MSHSKKNFMIGAVFGLIAAVLTLEIGSISVISDKLIAGALQTFLLDCLVPGLIAAMTLSGNAHAFHLWLAALANFILYFLLVWAFELVIRKIFVSENASKKVID